MLAAAREAISQAGWQVVNCDCIVFAQRPPLTPHKQAIRQRVAEILQIAPDSIGLKAKTGEGVDAVGRQEAIAAQCVVLIAYG
jgi:2-C-methyl-D-erythritol 2,4-cyclodiphosphate synthase